MLLGFNVSETSRATQVGQQFLGKTYAGSGISMVNISGHEKTKFMYAYLSARAPAHSQALARPAVCSYVHTYVRNACMHVCTYVCMYACMHARMCIGRYTCKQEGKQVSKQGRKEVSEQGSKEGSKEVRK